jgi:hypothetical protein
MLIQNFGHVNLHDGNMAILHADARPRAAVELGPVLEPPCRNWRAPADLHRHAGAAVHELLREAQPPVADGAAGGVRDLRSHVHRLDVRPLRAQVDLHECGRARSDRTRGGRAGRLLARIEMPSTGAPFKTKATPITRCGDYTGDLRCADRVPVSDHGTFGGLTQFLTQFEVSGSATGPANY